MAQRMKRAVRAVQDGMGTGALIPEPELATSSFQRNPQLRHDTSGIYTHDSSSSLFLADDEDSLAGSHDEADGELCQPHNLPNKSQPVAPHIIAHPRRAKRSPRSSDGVN